MPTAIVIAATFVLAAIAAATIAAIIDLQRNH
jgi:hypothetical protein